MLAFAMMAAIQHQANKPVPKKTKPTPAGNRSALSAGQSKKSAG
jgi:SRSO17 transposase